MIGDKNFVLVDFVTTDARKFIALGRRVQLLEAAVFA
jgi:hypothetical protein